MSDFRQQQECEHERYETLMAILKRVSEHDMTDAEFLAAECGLSADFRRYIVNDERRAA